MTDFALKVKGLTKTYPGNIEALKCIDLEVKSGDFYALLGPNGAGKSTAIGVISSLVTKSSGKVEILGIDIDENHSRAKRKLGVVGQEVNFAQFETVYQVLSHQAGFYGMPKAEVQENSEYFLKRLGLWDKPFKSDFNNNFNFLKLSESSLSVQIDEKNNLNDILKFFSSNDIEILSMTNETNKLEELFLSLTN